MANQKASLLDLVTKHHMTVVGASLRSMDQARQSNPVFLDIFSRMDRHKTSANRQQRKEKACAILSWPFSLVSLVKCQCIGL